jgi:hypothetical protein
MRSKKTLLSIAIVLLLTSAANADLVLTLNGLDTTGVPAEITGKDNLVIAVAGSTNIEPNAYSIEAGGGTINAIADPNMVNQQAEYSFTFEG